MLRIVGVLLFIAAHGVAAQVAKPKMGTPPPPGPTYDAVLAGMKCKQQKVGDIPQFDCEYRVGQSLVIAAPGLGGNGATFTIEKSDFDGDYYVSVGGMGTHDCAIVKPGKKRRVGAGGDPWDVAFISPRTGKVFTTWQECAKK